MALDMKATIAESFNSLVRQRGIDKVTVKAVIEDCGISRQTFYYHFQDIMDVVEWCARRPLSAWWSEVWQQVQPTRR